MPNGDHKVLKMLCAWGSALVAVVVGTIVVDARYISEAEANDHKNNLEAKLAYVAQDQARSAKDQAIYNEINMLETQTKIMDLEIAFIAEKAMQTRRDTQRLAYLQQSIAAMQSRILVLRGDLSGR